MLLFCQQKASSTEMSMFMTCRWICVAFGGRLKVLYMIEFKDEKVLEKFWIKYL